MIHKLKIEQNYLDRLTSGKKKAEIRFNDRDFQLNDILEFKEGCTVPGVYHRFKITHIHSGLGMKDCYVSLSIAKLRAAK